MSLVVLQVVGQYRIFKERILIPSQIDLVYARTGGFFVHCQAFLLSRRIFSLLSVNALRVVGWYQEH